ncbi:lipopolysaccharide-induced tumor necrosis factor-alpha factor-like [Silurus meridionalis]|nr:lipopolysaccharide-induced tumor necrosis factor-alpha factor-like [Silurus meridionalis]
MGAALHVAKGTRPNSSAKLGGKNYSYVIDDPLDDHYRIYFGSEQREMMTLEEDQIEMDSTEMWYIMTRVQQLKSRRSLLLELQEFLKKNSKEGDFCPKDDQGLYELEKIEKELQSLSEKESELTSRKGLQEKHSTTTTEITKESSVIDQSPSDEELNPTLSDPELLEVKDLAFSPAMVQCPTCKQHVTTEIQHKVGKTSFLLCYFSTLLGCVAGCCLLPFVLNYFKDTCHFCPSCHTEIQIVPRI